MRPEWDGYFCIGCDTQTLTVINPTLTIELAIGQGTQTVITHQQIMDNFVLGDPGACPLRPEMTTDTISSGDYSYWDTSMPPGTRDIRINTSYTSYTRSESFLS